MGALTKLEGMETQTRVFKRSAGRGWGVQCLRIKADGERCLNWAIQGAYVCRKHGGQLPTVRESAMTRFQALLNPAMEVLTYELHHGKPRDRLRAAKLVLRYSGITPQNVRSVMSKGEQAALPRGKGAPTVDEEIEGLIAIMTADVGDEEA